MLLGRPSPRISFHLPLLTGWMRLLGVLAGCAVAAGGIAMTLHAGLGVGPYDVLNSGISAQAGITFGTANVLASITACVLGWRLGAKVGTGTVIATLGIGPMVDFWRWLLSEPTVLGTQIAWFVIGLVLLSFGLSLIVAGNLGAGAIEVLMLGIVYQGISLRWARTGLEIAMCLAGLLLGGQFGLGTIVIALTIGHLMAAFVPREVAS